MYFSFVVRASARDPSGCIERGERSGRERLCEPVPSGRLDELVLQRFLRWHSRPAARGRRAERSRRAADAAAECGHDALERRLRHAGAARPARDTGGGARPARGCGAALLCRQGVHAVVYSIYSTAFFEQLWSMGCHWSSHTYEITLAVEGCQYSYKLCFDRKLQTCSGCSASSSQISSPRPLRQRLALLPMSRRSAEMLSSVSPSALHAGVHSSYLAWLSYGYIRNT